MTIPSRLKVIIIWIVCTSSLGQAASNTQIVELEMGKTLSFRDLGPNMDLIINAVDIGNITITTLDYERMQFKVTNGNGALGPTTVRQQVKIEGTTLLISRGNVKAYYIDSINVSMNHVKIAIVTD